MDIKKLVQQFLPKKGDEKKGEQGDTSEQEEVTQAQDPADDLMLKKILENLTSINKENTDRFLAVENRITALESKSEDHSEFKEVQERITKLESTLDQFTKVYELITAQYNPFVDDDEKSKNSTDNFAQSPQKEKTKAAITPQAIKDEQKKEDVHQDEAQNDTIPTSDDDTLKQTEGTITSTKAKDETKKEIDDESISSTDDSQKRNHSQKKNQLDSTNTDVVKSNDADTDDIGAEDIDTKDIDNNGLTLNNSLIDTQLYVSDDQAFVTRSSKRIHSLAELVEELFHMSEDEYNHFVTDDKNDFATWVHKTLKMDSLAKEMFEADSKDDLLYILADLL